ncbi:MAG: flagellar biosynthesis protein FliQ [Hyphomicrobiaceae bacterium]
MNETDAIEIGQAAIWAVILASGPAVSVAMAVGTAIALLQALTQVQELTLTFIPKIIAIFIVSAVSAPFMGSVIFAFTEQIYSRIESGF